MKHLPPFAAIALSATLASAVAAQITNGGFESLPEYAGWQTSGNVGLSSIPPAAPTDGTRCALLTANPIAGNVIASQAGCTMDQMQAAAATAAAIASGSAIWQTFTVAPGEQLTFDYAFNNAEGTNDQDWPDAAYLIVNGNVALLACSSSLPHGWTPVRHFTKANFTGNQATIAFVVCNLNDPAVSSQLMIDNVRLVAGSAASCGLADIGCQGAAVGPDARLDNNDFIVFIDSFFARAAAADIGSQGGIAGSDGRYDNNDFVAFVDAFFSNAGLFGC